MMLVGGGGGGGDDVGGLRLVAAYVCYLRTVSNHL